MTNQALINYYTELADEARNDEFYPDAITAAYYDSVVEGIKNNTYTLVEMNAFRQDYRDAVGGVLAVPENKYSMSPTQASRVYHSQ